MKNSDELKGKGDQVKGRAKQAWADITQAWADITNDERFHDEGVEDEASGTVQEGFGRARRKVGETMSRAVASPPSLCYSCKVLVGPRTPYLGPQPRLAHARAQLT